MVALISKNDNCARIFGMPHSATYQTFEILRIPKSTKCERTYDRSFNAAISN
jgi:hypothetical protein